MQEGQHNWMEAKPSANKVFPLLVWHLYAFDVWKCSLISFKIAFFYMGSKWNKTNQSVLQFLELTDVAYFLTIL